MKRQNILLQMCAFAIGAMLWHSASATNISLLPLYAGGGAKPNVLFIMDDSGSMMDYLIKSREATQMPLFDDLTTYLKGHVSIEQLLLGEVTGEYVSIEVPDTNEYVQLERIEAEDIWGENIFKVNNHPGYSGTGFVDFPNEGGGFLYRVLNNVTKGERIFTFRYANGSGDTRYAKFSVAGMDNGPVAFPPTGGWANWSTVQVTVNIRQDATTIDFSFSGEDRGPGGPNLDWVSVGMNVSETIMIHAGSVYTMLCPGVNKLAFDPTKTYRPWYGKPDSSFPLVAVDPRADNSHRIDLSGASYVLWDDANGDGNYDFGECGETVHYPGGTARVRLPASKLRPVANLDANQRANFANWYTYHRLREFAMIAGVSPVFASSRVRTGLTSISHPDDNPASHMNITDVDNFSDPSLQPQKDALLEKFFAMRGIKGGTPLRRSLENAGLYFHLENPSELRKPEWEFLPDVTKSPFLPEAEGGACQTNHMVLVTDGYQVEGDPNNRPRFVWGNVDGEQGGLYADSLPNTLADIAMYFATRDAAPDLPGKQIVHTHALGFGVFGSVSGYPTTLAEKDWPTDASKLVVGWSEPEYLESIDDVMHAAFNGGGKYMTATDADSLNTEMTALMKDISASYTGTANAVSFDREGVAASTKMFRTLYDMADFNGELNAYAFDAATGTVGEEIWEASKRLDQKNAANKRKIVTFNGVKGAPFVSPAIINAPNVNAGELDSVQLNDLLAAKPVNADKQGYLQDIIEFLRGDGDGYTTNPQFRNRPSLGDIVRSSPVFVGGPEGFYPEGFEAKEYSAFVEAHKDRTPIVYVGANDGMLHAFNAETGDEVFAYIPRGVFSHAEHEGLHWLADESYAHLPYVDETPVVGDVFVDNHWRSYLVGGLGRGGKSVYVLDITDPDDIVSEASLAAEVVVTEFSDSRMGYSFGTPRIAKMADGEWVAIFGNGYNNSTDGKAYLYVLYLDGAGPGGVDHLRIGPLGGASAGSVAGGMCEHENSDCNGLSAPTIVDTNMDGVVDRVYAGDLFGNLWAFDFSRDSAGNPVTADNPGRVVPVVAHGVDSVQRKPLFTACRGALVGGLCPAAHRQPITSKPSVTSHRGRGVTAGKPNLMVYVGTGRYLSESDVMTTDTQSVYGVWDTGRDDGGLTPNDLTEQAFILDDKGNRTIDPNSVAPVTYKRHADAPGNMGNYGWKMNLIAAERVIENPAVVNDVLLFSTLIASNNLCDRTGDGFVMGVDILTGAKPPFQVFPGADADIGIPVLSGGAIVRAQGAPLTWYASDPDSNASPAAFEVQTEPMRAPGRSSWTIMK